MVPKTRAQKKSNIIRWKSPQDLVQDLEMTGPGELHQFLTSDRFQKYFQRYKQGFIIPQQEAARASGKVARARGPELDTVQKRLAVAERPGSDKFSDPDPDKMNWDQTDHLAFTLYCIKRANLKSSNDVFYKKGSSDHDMDVRVWAMIKFMESQASPSKVNDQRKQEPPATQSPTSQQNQVEVAARDPRIIGEKNPLQLLPNQPAVIDLTTEARTTIVNSSGVSIRFPNHEDENQEAPVLEALSEADMEYFGGAQTLTNVRRLMAENKLYHTRFTL
ncbi:MAG: hypothetical protein Q9214_007712 [Letrouitia sp. 1 TL-2023]